MILRWLAAAFLLAFTGSLAAGEWVKNSVTNDSGTRAFELYVPSDLRPREKRPLLVAIHGCTQTAADFAGLARTAKLADAHRILIVHPTQTNLANPSLCWNWFLEDNQKRGKGEPSLIIDMVNWVKKRYSVDDTRIYVMGVSSGGYMTSILLSCYSDVFAAGAVASGGMYKAAGDVFTALQTAGNGSAMDPNVTGKEAFRCSGSVSPRLMPVLVFDGSEDPYVSNKNGRQVVTEFLQVNDLGDDGLDNESVSSEPASTASAESPGGLTYTWTTYLFGTTTLIQHYVVKGMGHAWGAGDPKFAYAEPKGPDESEIIWSFLSQHQRGAVSRAKRRAAGRN